MWPFGARLPIDQDELDFQLATFKWLIREFGPVGDRPLILPNPDFFPLTESRVQAATEELFEQVREHAGMADWPCQLEAGDSDHPLAGGAAIGMGLSVSGSTPCGTFRIGEGPEGRHAIITFDPGMARDRAGLAATFAHEFGHYLMATASEAPPGGWELHELHTDLAACYMGFGVLLANAARSFETFGTGRATGWRSSLKGYLSEQALVTATVIFQRLAGRDPAEAAPWLEPHLRGVLKKADKALARQAPDMAAAVAAIRLSEYA
ncbi:MAG TPA: hypothetical protein VEC11_14600 [Allosphingosinicella sp.]|nr:hypothetical protein [Allosphingosinicella sp.]